MLSARDRKRIEDDVADIIDDWAMMVQLWTPLPDDQQPGWDPIMHEVVGDIAYDKQLNVPAERRDDSLATLNTTVGGDKYDGNIIIHIASSYAKGITDDTIVILDDNTSEQWRIKNIAHRPGELTIKIMRMVGD